MNQTTTLDANYDAGLQAYLNTMFTKMFVFLFVSGAIALALGNTVALAIQATPLLLIPLLLAPFVPVLLMGFMSHKLSDTMMMGLAVLLSVTMGLMLSVILIKYTSASVTQIFFLTGALFGSMALWGYTTKRDLTSMGNFMMMGLIGIVIAGLVNMFIGSTILQTVISAIGVIVFLGLTAYDMQNQKSQYYDSTADELGVRSTMGAVSMYLNFINLFINLLQLFGSEKD